MSVKESFSAKSNKWGSAAQIIFSRFKDPATKYTFFFDISMKIVKERLMEIMPKIPL